MFERMVDMRESGPCVGTRSYPARMGYEVQITLDSNNPHELAKWWARAFGWQVESFDENMIRDLVASGRAQKDDTMMFDGTLVWKAGAATVDPDRPGTPRMLFQSVPEGRTVKNRMHLDLRVGDERESVAQELVDAGASVLYRGAQGPFEWITMTDPEGNEFCLT